MTARSYRPVLSDEVLVRILTAEPEVQTRTLAAELGMHAARVSSLRRREQKCAVVMASKLGLPPLTRSTA